MSEDVVPVEILRRREKNFFPIFPIPDTRFPKVRAIHFRGISHRLSALRSMLSAFSFPPSALSQTPNRDGIRAASRRGRSPPIPKEGCDPPYPPGTVAGSPLFALCFQLLASRLPLYRKPRTVTVSELPRSGGGARRFQEKACTILGGVTVCSTLSAFRFSL